MGASSLGLQVLDLGFGMIGAASCAGAHCYGISFMVALQWRQAFRIRVCDDHVSYLVLSRGEEDSGYPKQGWRSSGLHIPDMTNF